MLETGLDFGPVETVDGNALSFDLVDARFIRHWSSKSDQNSGQSARARVRVWVERGDSAPYARPSLRTGNYGADWNKRGGGQC